MSSGAKSVVCNWFYTQDGQEHTRYTVGENGVTAIFYNSPEKQGEKEHCLILKSSGERIMEFNLNTVVLL